MFRMILLLPLLLLGGCAAGSAEAEVAVLAEPELAEQAPYPSEEKFLDAKGNFDADAFDAAWRAWREEQSGRGHANTEALCAFTRMAAPEILQGEGNRLCSPLNLYLALGMLTEVTDGESRQQLLTLLQQPDMAALRGDADSLWTAHYRDDGAAASRLAASLWLRQDMDYREAPLAQLRDTYRASAFRGVMGAAETDEALQRWINENTGDLLTEQAAGIKLNKDTILALVSTIYYNARWSQIFDPGRTAPGIFHAADGDVDCALMHRSAPMTYHWGEHFAAVTLGLEEGHMELILPDEGVTPAMLLEEEEFWDYALNPGEWAQQKYLVVRLGLPRFDVAGDLELGKSLRELGVRDVFDASRADFSPLGVPEAFLSQVRHAARVKADEEGVEAAAYTVMMVAGAAMPPEERVELTLDRPFVFVLKGNDGAPLFVGVVETP